MKQFIEIVGSVADENLQSSSLKPFHYIYLYFNSVCKPSTKKVVMKVNPGMLSGYLSIISLFLVTLGLS